MKRFRKITEGVTPPDHLKMVNDKLKKMGFKPTTIEKLGMKRLKFIQRGEIPNKMADVTGVIHFEVFAGLFTGVRADRCDINVETTYVSATGDRCQSIINYTLQNGRWVETKG